MSAALNLVAPYEATFTLHVRALSLTNRHVHWRRKHETSKRDRVATWGTLLKTTGVTQRVLGAGETATVTLTRVSPRDLDDDNLPPSMKSIRDEIAAWLGLDDRDKRVKWQYAQERGKPKEYAVRVRVEIAETAAAEHGTEGR